ncbi:MAG: hypothetical protein NTX45_14450 [Proteobacteria bacterium]|nr:hypothetical protein [Pseudomonadota bacterium]
MISHTTKTFRQLLSRLPKEVRSQAREAYRLFKNDPNHPSLHFKKVHTHQPIYSARVNLDYRSVGVIHDGDIIGFWIGPHREYEKLLTKL